MALSLGEKLRQAREERGISISEVAEQTRISPLYLKSIEKDDYKPLPGGIFNKGFVRSYARYIGFDEDEALHDYAQMVADHEVADENDQRVYRPEVLTDDRAGRSLAPSIILGALIILLIIGGISLLIGYLANRPPSSQAAVNTTVANTNSPANAAVNTNVNAQTTASSGPTMGVTTFEFSTSDGDISLTSLMDGKPGNQLVAMGKPASFQPQESLRLRYSKSLATSARLAINGKQIVLPQVPASPKLGLIEFEITKDNLSSIYQTGEVKFVPAEQPTQQTAQQTPRPAVPRPTVEKTPSNANAGGTPAKTPEAKPTPKGTVITVPPPTTPKKTP
jgi:cytoskeletal protein RodZ